MKTINTVIGLGTGRCGTVTFSTLINIQSGFNATHETFHKVASWEFNNLYFNKLTNYIIDGFSDVSNYNLPYVEELIKIFPELKFVCLKRNKNETTHSYMNKTNRNSNGEARNHWTDRNSIHWNEFNWRLDPIWDKCFPKFDLPKFDAIQSYWDLYYEHSFVLEKRYPDNFKVVDTYEVLNQEDCQSSILSFIGINDTDKKFLINKKMNVGKDQ